MWARPGGGCAIPSLLFAYTLGICCIRVDDDNPSVVCDFSSSVVRLMFPFVRVGSVGILSISWFPRLFVYSLGPFVLALGFLG